MRPPIRSLPLPFPKPVCQSGPPMPRSPAMIHPLKQTLNANLLDLIPDLIPHTHTYVKTFSFRRYNPACQVSALRRTRARGVQIVWPQSCHLPGSIRGSKLMRCTQRVTHTSQRPVVRPGVSFLGATVASSIFSSLEAASPRESPAESLTGSSSRA
jgi:hypothetical protein